MFAERTLAGAVQSGRAQKNFGSVMSPMARIVDNAYQGRSLARTESALGSSSSRSCSKVVLLSSSSPLLELFAARGDIRDARLHAPAIVDLKYMDDGRTVVRDSEIELKPNCIERRMFDFCAPMLAVPLGNCMRRA